MAWANVQAFKDTTAGGGAGSNSLAFTSNVTAGNQLFCIIYCASGTATVSAISDNPAGGSSNTWTSLKSEHGNGLDVFIYGVASCVRSGTDTVSVTTSSDGGFTALAIAEFSGGTLTVDGSSVSTSAATTSVTTGTWSTTNASDLLLGAVCEGAHITAGETGWTNDISGDFNAVEYKIVSTTQTNVAATWTSTSGVYAAAGLGLQAAGFTVSMQAKSTNTFQVVAAVTTTMQAKATNTLKVVAAVNTNMQAKATNTIQVVAAVTTGMTVHSSNTFTATGGGQPVTPPTFYFTDGSGLHRVAPD